MQLYMYTTMHNMKPNNKQQRENKGRRRFSSLAILFILKILLPFIIVTTNISIVESIEEGWRFVVTSDINEPDEKQMVLEQSIKQQQLILQQQAQQYQHQQQQQQQQSKDNWHLIENMNDNNKSYLRSSGSSNTDSNINSNDKNNEAPLYHGIKTHKIIIENNEFYGPFVSPHDHHTNPPKNNELLVVFPMFELRNNINNYYCHYYLSYKDNNRDTSSMKHNEVVTKMDYDAGAMYCPMPEQYIIQDPNRTYEYLPIRITNHGKTHANLDKERQRDNGDKAVDIIIHVATWPYRASYNQRNGLQSKYNIIQTSMIKDLNCNANNPNFCIKDWLEWHRMIGIDHFVLYDNGSSNNAMHLNILLPYIQKNIVTLIHWPYELNIGNEGNNHVQRIALNHAIYAFSSRTKWMSFFDVDEFFIPKKALVSLTDKDNNILPTISSILPNASPVWNTHMQTMVHPEYCLNPHATKTFNTELDHPIPYSATTTIQTKLKFQNDKLLNPTSRLSLCTHRARPSSSIDHPKMFINFDFFKKPFSIITPHALGNTWLDRDEVGHFMHFSDKYGCQSNNHNDNNDDDDGCVDESIMIQNGIQSLIELENRLASVV